MSGWKKLASAAAASGDALNVEDVFSTYLYTGDSTSPRTITNGIDLSGEGGLVWFKSRTTTTFHGLFDTERGATKRLRSDSTNAEDTLASDLTAFNSDGFTLGNGGTTNTSPREYASWTFRKAPKFFDVVTYTGNGTAGREISHNLGTTVGTIIVKRLNAGTNWGIYHRSNTSSPEGQVLEFDTGATTSNTTIWNNTAPTSTVFTVGNSPYSNFNGSTYVAYLFAHNDGDGDFGPTGDQDIIKCGSYTYSNGLEIDLGFEPQWLLYKQSSTTGSWRIVDNMRGWGVPSTEKFLYPNLSNAEAAGGQIDLTSTGFKVHDAGTGDYIYIAIRRGPMAVPESATDVFAIDTKTDDPRPAFISDFPVDMALWRRKHTTSNWANSARLIQGKFLYTNDFTTEGSNTINAFDFQDGWYDDQGADNRILSWMWKRAPNFFDVVAYSGSNAASLTVDHNLGVTPEMIWVKSRSKDTSWRVYHKDLSATPESSYLTLDTSASVVNNNDSWYNTSPTSTAFTVEGSNGTVSQSGHTYIAYLFASLDGVSKLGSYTGNGGTSVTGTGQNIDCGFSSGARFVLIKPTNAADHWFVYDSERGIVAGNDATLQLNLTTGESVSSDEIDPYSSGFTILNGNNQLNRTGREYIFYAVA